MSSHGGPDRSPDPGPSAGGINAGRVAGIPLRVSPSWFLVAALLTVLFAPVVEDNVPGVGGWSYAVAAAFAVLLYASVLVHELGHALVARAFGLPVRQITLHLLGGFTEIEQESRKPSEELLIAAAGPALSLAIGFGALPLLIPLEPRTVSYVLVLQLAAANLLVGVFNLLPGLPLDGGRVLRAVVWGATGRPLTGTRVAAHVGRVMAAGVLALPFLLAWWGAAHRPCSALSGPGCWPSSSGVGRARPCGRRSCGSGCPACTPGP